MKIEIERFIPEKVDVYYKNEYYGTFNNEQELMFFQIQLVKNKITDLYYLIWKNQKITFNKYGELSNYPDGMYNQILKSYATLHQLRKEIKNEEKNL